MAKPHTIEELRKILKKSKKRSNLTNQLTRDIIAYLNLNGFIAWRNNTVGIFDQNKAVKHILALNEINEKTIKQALQKSYRKSHDRTGVSDIIGFEKSTGRIIAVEVKTGSDQLSILQAHFLQQVKENGGIAFKATCLDDVIKSIN